MYVSIFYQLYIVVTWIISLGNITIKLLHCGGCFNVCFMEALLANLFGKLCNDTMHSDWPKGGLNVFVRAAHSPAALTNESGIYTFAKKIWLSLGRITLCWRRQAARLRRRPPRALLSLQPGGPPPSSLLRPHWRPSTLLPAAGARARACRRPTVSRVSRSATPAPPKPSRRRNRSSASSVCGGGRTSSAAQRSRATTPSSPSRPAQTRHHAGRSLRPPVDRSRGSRPRRPTSAGSPPQLGPLLLLLHCARLSSDYSPSWYVAVVDISPASVRDSFVLVCCDLILVPSCPGLFQIWSSGGLRRCLFVLLGLHCRPRRLRDSGYVSAAHILPWLLEVTQWFITIIIITQYIMQCIPIYIWFNFKWCVLAAFLYF
jgi:hypothetical protein